MQVAEVYLDESSQTKHRYLVLGCLVMREEDRQALQSAFAAARLPELPYGELKWTKISNGKRSAYERVINAFFDISKWESGPHFHSIVVDTSKIDDRRFNDGSREIGFNKEVYQLLMKVRRLYPDHLFHVYPDQRTTSHGPEQLRLVCNRGATKKGDAREWPFRRVHWRDSGSEPCLQMVDLLIGGLAYQINGHHAAADASASKRDLSLLISTRAKIANIMRDTAVSSHFTVWHRQLRQSRG